MMIADIMSSKSEYIGCYSEAEQRLHYSIPVSVNGSEVVPIFYLSQLANPHFISIVVTDVAPDVTIAYDDCNADFVDANSDTDVVVSNVVDTNVVDTDVVNINALSVSIVYVESNADAFFIDSNANVINVNADVNVDGDDFW